MVYCESGVVVEWSCGRCAFVSDGGPVAASIDDKCRRPTSPFKEREEPSGLPSWISFQSSGG
jgi:hypothetical protein